MAAANKEKEGDYVSAERGYENALWLVQTMLDEIIWDGRVKDEDRATVDACMSCLHIGRALTTGIALITGRLKDFRVKLESRQRLVGAAQLPSSAPSTASIVPMMGDRTYSSSVPSQALASAQPPLETPAAIVSVSPQALTPLTSNQTGTAPVRSSYRPATTTYAPVPLHNLGTPL